MYSRAFLTVAVLALSAILPQRAAATELMGFMDSCVAAKYAYWDERKQMMMVVGSANDDNPVAKPSPEFVSLWWAEKRGILHKYFDQNIAAALKINGAPQPAILNAAFEIWLAQQMADSGGAKSLVSAEYRRLKRLVHEKKAGATMAELDKSRSELYDSCPEDIGSQLFRGSLIMTGEPSGIVSRNVEMSRIKSVAIVKVLMTSKKTSVGAIVDSGAKGGENIEARKACETVGGSLNARC